MAEENIWATAVPPPSQAQNETQASEALNVTQEGPLRGLRGAFEAQIVSQEGPLRGLWGLWGL